MTSTSFNVGINEGRNSSRVLRPPGGGHSDIFGNKEPASSAESTKKGNPRNASSILEGTNACPTSPIKEPPKQRITPTEPEKPIDDGPTIRRPNRVPPGGFSNGLW